MAYIRIVFVQLAILLLLSACVSNTSLYMLDAARNGDTARVNNLLNAGANVNARNELRKTPLMWAAQNGYFSTVQLLLERGADPNAMTLSLDTALSLAVENEHPAVVALIQSYQAKINQQNGNQLKEKADLTAKTKPAKKIIDDINNIPDFGSTHRENDLAIIIGIENYKDIPKSDFSKSDAGLVKDYLKAMGYEERNIEYLVDERATFTGIKKTVESWLPNRAKKDSNVFIYYSGHGAPEAQTGDAYIVPFDGDPNYLPDTGYPIKRLYDKVAKLEAKEVIVILDSCFSGAGGRSVLAKGARPLVLNLNEGAALSPNLAVLSATQGTQISVSSPEKGHGIFTYYFLKAIKDGKKDLKEIYSYIKPLVEDEAKRLNVLQSPSLNPVPEMLNRRFSLVN